MSAFRSASLALALLALAAPAARASGWHGRTFADDVANATPRAAVAADGTSFAVWMTSEAIVAAEGDAAGRFAAPITVTRAPTVDFAVAAGPGQQGAVA